MSASSIVPDERGTTACRPSVSTCPLCGHGSFRVETETTKAPWGFRRHVKTLLVCNGCRYVVVPGQDVRPCKSERLKRLPATPARAVVSSGGRLEVTEREPGGVRVVEVTGELDLSTAPDLCLRMDAARRIGHRRVLWISPSWSSATPPGSVRLILAAQEITACAGAFGVVVLPGDGAVAKRFRICGAVAFLRTFPALADGLAALGGTG